MDVLIGLLGIGQLFFSRFISRARFGRGDAFPMFVLRFTGAISPSRISRAIRRFRAGVSGFCSSRHYVLWSSCEVNLLELW